MEIRGIDSLLPVNPVKKNVQTEDNVRSFGAYLHDALNQVNASQLEAEHLIQDFAVGCDVELHQVVLATEKANLALQLTIQIKNKVIEAYQEIMRMQI